jgi:hypothetical protein
MLLMISQHPTARMAVKDARSVRAAQRSKILDGHRSGTPSKDPSDTDDAAARYEGRPFIMRGRA